MIYCTCRPQTICWASIDLPRVPCRRALCDNQLHSLSFHHLESLRRESCESTGLSEVEQGVSVRWRLLMKIEALYSGLLFVLSSGDMLEERVASFALFLGHLLDLFLGLCCLDFLLKKLRFDWSCPARYGHLFKSRGYVWGGVRSRILGQKILLCFHQI